MSTQFSESDKQLLNSMGISTEPTLGEDRLALAKRIAKHRAPCQVTVDPDAARLELIRFALKRLLTAAAEAREPGDEDDE